MQQSRTKFHKVTSVILMWEKSDYGLFLRGIIEIFIIKKHYLANKPYGVILHSVNDKKNS